jgi:hypothetical protein
VFRLMRQVVAEQRWGLGSAGTTAAFKGGWGPGADGRYLVRQMGVVQVGGRPLAVSLLTEAADGSFATGAASATAIARWGGPAR